MPPGMIDSPSSASLEITIPLKGACTNRFCRCCSVSRKRAPASRQCSWASFKRASQTAQAAFMESRRLREPRRLDSACSYSAVLTWLVL